MRISPSERDASAIADWAEVQVLYSSAPISDEIVRTKVDVDGSLLDETERISSEEDEPELPPEVATEMQVAEVFREIQRRQKISGDSYPFDVSDGTLRLKRRPKRFLAYIFCLLVSDREYWQPGDTSPILFEHLAGEALRRYLAGDVVRFGAPRDTMAGPIAEAASQLARALGVRRYDTSRFHLEDTDQDRGLDVAAWKNFPDGYTSRVKIFTQCATGENWREEAKKGQPDLEEWRRVLDFTAMPLRGLAVLMLSRQTIGEDGLRDRIARSPSDSCDPPGCKAARH